MKEKQHRFHQKHPVLFGIPAAVVALFGVPGLMLGLILYHGNAHHPYDFLQQADQISEIRLIDMAQDFELYQYATDEISGILDAAGSDENELSPADHSAFLSDFASVPRHEWVNDPCPFIRGRTILISYLDGSREWICADGTFYQDLQSGKTSMTRFYFDAEAFAALLRNYDFK